VEVVGLSRNHSRPVFSAGDKMSPTIVMSVNVNISHTYRLKLTEILTTDAIGNERISKRSYRKDKKIKDISVLIH
jgi:hypothetical protein